MLRRQRGQGGEQLGGGVVRVEDLRREDRGEGPEPQSPVGLPARAGRLRCTGPTSPEAYKNSIRAMVTLAKANHIMVVLGSIPSLG